MNWESAPDESYLVGEGKKPVDAYLDIEDIIRIAHEHDVDAIHPGYGFLSENADLAKRCEEEGIIFIGPKVEHLIMFGDKINARIQAKKAGIQYIPGSDGPVMNYELPHHAQSRQRRRRPRHAHGQPHG